MPQEAVLTPQILPTPLGGSRLARAYLAADEAALAFYGRARPDGETLDDLVATLDAQWDADRRTVTVDLLRGQATNDSERLDRFVSEGGFVVSTGQQAGYLTGPLYTFSKALAALAHARRLERCTGRPVLPVFWVASEDHDWAEAETAVLAAGDGTPRPIVARPSEDPAGRSVFRVPLEGVDADLESLATLWPAGAFSRDVVELVRAAYPPGATLADGFESLLDTLLGPLGLFIVQAHDPVLKAHSRPLLAASIRDASARLAELDARGAALEEAGFHQQVTWAAGATNVLVDSDEGRVRLYVHGGHMRVGAEGPTVTPDDVVARLEADPSYATPDALLRPVVEAHALPVLSYIAGPGEIAYYAQNEPLYEAAGVIRPDVLGRSAVRVVEPKVRRALDRIGLEPDDVMGPLHELQTRIAQERIPDEVYETIRQTRASLEEGIGALAQSAAGIDPTMAGPVEQAGRRGLQSLERAEKKIMQAVKRRSTEALAHLDRARAGLLPGGVPQERSINIFHFLGRYGLGFLEAFEAAVNTQVENGVDP